MKPKPMYIERNGTWRKNQKPVFATTWAAYYFEWIVLGVCFGLRIPKWRSEAPKEEE